MAVELVADRGADEVGPVGVESVLDHQVDMAEIDEAKIDGDLLAIVRHPSTIHMGWYLAVAPKSASSGPFTPARVPARAGRVTRPERIAIGSIGVGCLVLALKGAAWWISASAALYSDALETTVNVAASAIALYAIRLAAKPADEDHPYGHDKAEFFAAVIVGVLIVIAALSIFREAWKEAWAPHLLTLERARDRAQRGGDGAEFRVVAPPHAARAAVALRRARRRWAPPHGRCRHFGRHRRRRRPGAADGPR